MNFIEMITQLLRYTDKDKRKFDFVAAMGMAELGDEELSLKKPKAQETENNQFQDFGYYYDSNGRKQYGLVPAKEERNGNSKHKNNDS